MFSYSALQVQVTRITVVEFYTEAELKCRSSCSPAGRLSYLWYKNEQRTKWTQTSSYKDRFHPGDIISCALQGHENYRSPSVCEFTPLTQDTITQIHTDITTQ